jgi:hypothetical protein
MSLSDTFAARIARRSEAAPYKRSHLVALRPTNITATDPPSTVAGRAMRSKAATWLKVQQAVACDGPDMPVS